MDRSSRQGYRVDAWEIASSRAPSPSPSLFSLYTHLFRMFAIESRIERSILFCGYRAAQNSSAASDAGKYFSLYMISRSFAAPVGRQVWVACSGQFSCTIPERPEWPVDQESVGISAHQTLESGSNAVDSLLSSGLLDGGGVVTSTRVQCEKLFMSRVQLSR